MVLDKTNRVIIDILTKNAKTPKSSIAKQLGVTEAAVRKRLKKLEDSGVVLSYKAVIDYQKAGLAASITGVNADPDKLWKIIDSMKGMKEVRSITLTTGDHTLVAEIVTNSIAELEEIHRKLEGIDGVKGVYPAIILRHVKT